jgi:hypothetical protein
MLDYMNSEYNVTDKKMQDNEIVLYQPNNSIRLEVRMADESVWLTQNQIAMLFGVGQPAISKHLNNIFRSGELDENSVYSILEYTAADGKVYMTKFYNLDAILSVGYRVNSVNATIFLCVDETVYHIGASLKDLGKKWFAFCKMKVDTTTLIQKM